MQRSSRFWLAVVAASAVGAFSGGCSCGSSTPNPDGGNDSGSPADSGADGGADAGCAAWAAADCAFIGACEPGTMQGTYGNLTNCQTVLTASCNSNLNAPGGGMTTAWLAACQAQFTTEVTACASGPVPLPIPAPSDGCALVGAGAGGSACGIDAQCATNFCNRVGTLCGTCTATGALGMPCGPGTGVNCARGLACGAKDVCATVVGVGSSCDLGATTECVDGAFCVVANTDAGTGMCQAGGTTAGAACNTQSIGSARCSEIAGFNCNAATSQCQAIIYASAGAACGPSNGDAGSVDTECSDG